MEKTTRFVAGCVLAALFLSALSVVTGNAARFGPYGTAQRQSVYGALGRPLFADGPCGCFGSPSPWRKSE